MRVAINLLTDHPDHPTGAHWGWTRTIPEMAKLLTPDEEFLLVVSPRSRPLHQGYGDNVSYVTFPWSNEAVIRRTLSEHLYSPLRLPLSGVDIFSTLIAPLVKPAPSLVAHFKTMHAYATPESLRPLNRIYRQMGYPHTARVADAIILNSTSLLHEVQKYLDVDPAKLHLIPEAVDHDLFRPGDRDEATELVSRKYGVNRPFVLFVSSLWSYKNCHGLLRAFAAARPELGERQLAIVGAAPRRDVRRRAPRAGRRAGDRQARRLGRRGAARGDGELLPLLRRVRLPVVQRDLRPADPGGHGLRRTGRHVERVVDARDRGGRSGSRRSSRPGVHRRRAGSRLRARAGRVARGRLGPCGGVHLGDDRGADAGGVPAGLRPASAGPAAPTPAQPPSGGVSRPAPVGDPVSPQTEAASVARAASTAWSASAALNWCHQIRAETAFAAVTPQTVPGAPATRTPTTPPIT